VKRTVNYVNFLIELKSVHVAENKIACVIIYFNE